MRLKQLIMATATGAFFFIGCNSDDGGPAYRKMSLPLWLMMTAF